jgi:hypothetical protein
MAQRTSWRDLRATAAAAAALLAGAAAYSAAQDACPIGPAPTLGTQHCSSNQTGRTGSLGWSIWSSGSGGCITPSENTAAFKATWNNSGDFLARAGFQWDETKTYDAYGNLSADYTYTKTGTAGGYSYVGIYGWSNNPLIEFYIVDDWYGSGRAPTAGGTLKGTFTADSGTYKVYTHQQVGQPSIHGNNATFMQYFSIRQTPRQCGHISLTQHFDAWKGLGLNLGKMYEAKLLIEVGGGSGSIDFSLGTMTAGSISLAPREFARGRRIDPGAGESGILSLLAVDGTVLKTVRRDAADGPSLPFGDMPKGMYLLRFQGISGASDTRRLLLP